MLLVQVKIMPSSPSSDLARIKQEVEKIIKKHKEKILKEEIQPIAFGLNAMLLTVSWPDDKSADELEEQLSEIEDVNSAQIVDVRRAIG